MRTMGAIKISGLVVVLIVLLVLIGNSLSGLAIVKSPVPSDSDETSKDTPPSDDPDTFDSDPAPDPIPAPDTFEPTITPTSGSGSSGSSSATPPSSTVPGEVVIETSFGSGITIADFEEVGGAAVELIPVGDSSFGGILIFTPGVGGVLQAPEGNYLVGPLQTGPSDGDVRPCVSSWLCSEWESCISDFQHRTCEDLNDCEIPTNSPRKTTSCTSANFCEEDWECSWSECSPLTDFSNPIHCIDSNNCGTEYELPDSQNCNAPVACSPKFTCGDWSDCDVDYGFNSFDEGSENLFGGLQHRTCEDLNLCGEPTKQSRSCALEKDIEIVIGEQCDSAQFVLSDLSNGEIVAKIDKEKFEITLGDDGSEGIELCTSCLNGLLDSDKGEEGVDCGGEDCLPCDVKYGPVVFEEESFFEKVTIFTKTSFVRDIFDLFKNIFS